MLLSPLFLRRSASHPSLIHSCIGKYVRNASSVRGHRTPRPHFSCWNKQWRGIFPRCDATRSTTTPRTLLIGRDAYGIRCFASSGRTRAIRILYGSQGGTAQLFAMQLSDQLMESSSGDVTVSVSALNEASPRDLLSTSEGEDVVHVFLISVAGVGEAPENAREFHEWLMGSSPTDFDFSVVRYAVFGLGNSRAHPNHYNVIGKGLDAKLEELGGGRVHSLGLGDDSECIDDDFDAWQESIVGVLCADNDLGTVGDDQGSDEEKKEEMLENGGINGDSVQDSCVDEDVFMIDCHAAKCQISGRRRASTKYPRLRLRASAEPMDAILREDLRHLNGSSTPFYQPETYRMQIIKNRALSANGEYSLYEMVLSTKDHPNITYEAGDHVILYPQNGRPLVEAYLDICDIDPQTVIEGIDVGATGINGCGKVGRERTYPHPVGITLEETLTHCVDLGAVPSPPFARLLLGKKDIDYKENIAQGRKTVLELCHEGNAQLSLEDLLFNLQPMQPRYYSIASSPLANPRDIYLTYRPIKYVSNRGSLREGVCTSYMKTLRPFVEDEQNPTVTQPYVLAGVRTNPTFRLPKDDSPVLLIAGGCGIAPIRGFIEERLSHAEATAASNQTNTFGETHLFLGFRSPSDKVYGPLIDRALACGAVTDAKISFVSGCVSTDELCQYVSETLTENGSFVFDLLRRGGHAYLCGGARVFGASIERAMLDIFATHGNMTMDESIDYLKEFIKHGRFHEDLAD